MREGFMAQSLGTIAFRTSAAIAAIVAIYLALGFAIQWAFFQPARPLQPLFTVQLDKSPALEAVKARAVRSGYSAESGENAGGPYLNVDGEGCYVMIYIGANKATHIDVARFSDVTDDRCDERRARRMVAGLTNG
jgi:hypothetical protein